LEVLDSALQYLPTALVALILGYFTYRVQNAGRADTARMEEKATRISETQQALDAQLSIAEQWKAAYLEERQRRVAVEEELRECESLKRQEFEDSIRKMLGS
jgi:hypothetical protein